MEHSRTCLCMFLLLNKLSLCLATTDLANDGNNQTEGSTSNPITLMPATALMPTTERLDHHDTNANITGADCLMDTQMGLIAVASAGGLILCLLASTIVLACQVCCLQRRLHAPRHSRSNVDLVSGTGYWGTDRPGAGGVIGPCDASVMMEEVRADMEMDKQASGEEASGEKDDEAIEFDPNDLPPPIPSSLSRDSCLDVPRDLEDTPLVV